MAPLLVASTEKLLDQMREEPGNIRFSELLRICEEHFGTPRQSAGSHIIFKTPWTGNPRINIQNDKGRAKTYQVKQVLFAIEKLKGQR